MKTTLFISLFIIVIINGCTNKNNPYTKSDNNFIYEEKIIPDSLIAENYVDSLGLRNGFWIIFLNNDWLETFYKNAIYYRKINYINNIPSGKVVNHYLSGVLQWEGYYSNDHKFDKKCIWYREDGTCEKIVNYKNGIISGEYTEFYQNNNIKEVKNFNNEKLHGSFISYYNNGNIKIRTNYYNGNFHGNYNEFFESGSNAKTGYYNNGVKGGNWIYYDEDGDYRKTAFQNIRVGAICRDGSRSSATGRGACSRHGGVSSWVYDTREVLIAGTGKYK